MARIVTAVLIGRVGDTLVAGPMLRALKARHPGAALRLIAHKRQRQAAELLPWVDERIYLGTEVLRAARADVAVDLNPAPSRTAAVLLAALRAPVKAGFAKDRLDGMLSVKAARPADDEPMLSRYARLAEALSAPYEPRLEARLSKEHEDWAASLALGKAPVLIHCGNFKKFDNRWPEEKFALLGTMLANDFTVHWLAGPGERAAVEAIAAAAKTGTVVAPPSLGATGALMRRVDCVIGSITGTTHLAHAVGARSFGLYAGYTAAVWRPEDARAGGVVSPEWTSCRSIGVDEAYDKLRHFLAAAGKK